jgi:hypothetical protein
LYNRDGDSQKLNELLDLVIEVITVSWCELQDLLFEDLVALDVDVLLRVLLRSKTRVVVYLYWLIVFRLDRSSVI